MRVLAVVVNKEELAGILKDKFRGTLINNTSLYEKFITSLEWHDEEPRDITGNDIMLVEDLIAEELDGLLTLLEKSCFNAG